MKAGMTGLTIALLAASASAGEMHHGETESRTVNIAEAPVMTFPGFEDEQRRIENATARLVTTEDTVFVAMDTRELKPNHAYTMWFVPINAPEACENSPCNASDVIGNREATRSDVSFGDGAVADDSGMASFAAHRTSGELPGAWFGAGLQEPAKAEIHLVIRDHGPASELEDVIDAISTHNGGCTVDSAPDFENAKLGAVGDYKCHNVQDAIFLQQVGS